MYKKHTLKNGLKIITSTMPHMESASIGVWITVGSRWEDKAKSGISHLAEHMLFKGTQKRSASELKESIEGIGGNFNGFTSEEATCYLVKVPASYVELGLDVLSDMVLDPKLEDTELEKEKSVICEEIKMYEDQPAHLVFDILAEHMWPNHALGRPIAGCIKTVTGLRRSDLTDFIYRFYQPSNIVIVACGRIKKDEVQKFAKRIFQKIPAKKSPGYKAVKDIHKGAEITSFYKETNQTRLALGFHGLHRTHKLKYALLLLDVILGANMSSRLFDGLREKKGLCYDIASSVKKYKETGIFFIWAGVDHKKLQDASRDIISELARIKKELVTADELGRAKKYSKGQLLLGLEDTTSRMLWLGDRITTIGYAPRVDELLRNIKKVKAEDIRTVANMIFKRQNLNFATVGPAKEEIKKELEKILVI